MWYIYNETYTTLISTIHFFIEMAWEKNDSRNNAIPILHKYNTFLKSLLSIWKKSYENLKKSSCNKILVLFAFHNDRQNIIFICHMFII